MAARDKALIGAALFIGAMIAALGVRTYNFSC
jgi:hypothetical protein